MESPGIRLIILLLALAVQGAGEVSAQSWQEEPRGDTLLRVTHRQVLDAVRRSDARVVVVNMWATWCAPCVKEFPWYVELDRKYVDGRVSVMFVSVDFADEAESVRKFLTDRQWRGASYIKQEKDHSFVNGLNPSWSGAVPASFVYNDDAELIDFWEGEITRSELEARIEKHVEDGG